MVEADVGMVLAAARNRGGDGSCERAEGKVAEVLVEFDGGWSEVAAACLSRLSRRLPMTSSFRSSDYKIASVNTFHRAWP